MPSNYLGTKEYFPAGKSCLDGYPNDTLLDRASRMMNEALNAPLYYPNSHLPIPFSQDIRNGFRVSAQ
jgi:hypothetical protein